jgi:DNA-binding PadR family transcriptional regulator
MARRSVARKRSAWRGMYAAGAVYAALDRLERKGLVISELGSGRPIRPARRDGSIG